MGVFSEDRGRDRDRDRDSDRARDSDKSGRIFEEDGDEILGVVDIYNTELTPGE